VFNARPKMRTRPVVVPVKPAAKPAPSGPTHSLDNEED